MQRNLSYATRTSVENRKITEQRTRDTSMESILQSNNLVWCSLDHINTVVTFSVNTDGENVTGLFQPPLTTSDEHSYVASEEDSFDESMHDV